MQEAGGRSRAQAVRDMRRWSLIAEIFAKSKGRAADREDSLSRRG